MYRTACSSGASWRQALCLCGLRIGLLAVLLSFSNALRANDYLTPAIDPNELRGTSDRAGMLIIDLRSPVEYQVAHIPGARNIEPDTLEQHLDEIRAADRTVLYCIIGKRTREAEQLLLAHDLANLYHLDGGFGAWIRGGLPVEKVPARPTSPIATP